MKQSKSEGVPHIFSRRPGEQFFSCAWCGKKDTEGGLEIRQEPCPKAPPATKTLKDIKPGERVILCYERRNRSGGKTQESAETVKSVTAKGLSDSSGTWYDFTGRAIRGDRRYRGYSIRAARPGELEALDRQRKDALAERQKKEEELRAHENTDLHRVASMLASLDHERWEQLGEARLLQIESWIFPT